MFLPPLNYQKVSLEVLGMFHRPWQGSMNESNKCEGERLVLYLLWSFLMKHNEPL